MTAITEQVIATLRRLVIQGDTLHDDDVAKLRPLIEESVAKVAAESDRRIASLEADMKAIADAIVNPELTADMTTLAVGNIIGVQPVNSLTAEEATAKGLINLKGGGETVDGDNV